MIKKILSSLIVLVTLAEGGICADGFPLRGSEEMWMTPPPRGQRAHDSAIKVLLYRAGGQMHPSYRNRFYPEVSNREYINCSYYKYCDCNDMRNSRCWQCRHWIYDWQYTE